MCCCALACSWQVVFGSKLNILVLFLPVAIILKVIEWKNADDDSKKLKYDGAIFVVSLVALCPLAEVRKVSYPA